jgi:hypothetical protein
VNVLSNIGHKSCSFMIVKFDISEDSVHITYSGCVTNSMEPSPS